MDYKRIRDFYIDGIENNLLPYWIDYADKEYGGVLNCISNDGKKLLSSDKFSWSQGRWLWILSTIFELTEQGVFSSVDMNLLSTLMINTFEFIRKYVVTNSYRCHFLLDRYGNVIPDDVYGRTDLSIYADCFVLIGMSSYIRVMHDEKNVPLADRLCVSIVKRLKSGDYLTEPYPIPSGYSVHGVPMIMLNTLDEYAKMRESFGLDSSFAVSLASKELSFILDRLYDEKRGLIREHASDDVNSLGRLIDRHVNPGHILEDAWFWIEHLERYGDLRERLFQIERIVSSTFSLGWDDEYGGLFRFVDCDGGMPHGDLICTPYEKLIAETWDMKLWWPHSEALYISLLLPKITNKECYEEMYLKTSSYVFSVFPKGADKEWIQIRKRDGKPEDKVVALPVKDPFHILRDYLKIIVRMDKCDTAD